MSQTAVQLAVAAGMLLAGVGILPGLPGLFLAVAGVALCVWPLRSLLPKGTFSTRPVLPASLAARALFATAFFTTETYVVLALTRISGYPESTTGLVVTVTSLSWAAGDGLQARLDRRDEGRGRNGRVLAGVVAMALGVAVVQPVVWAPGLALPLALAAHIILGMGLGLAHPTSGLIAFAWAPRGAEGAVTSYLLLADLFTPAVGIGVGGALVAIAAASGSGVRTGVAAALGLSLLFILFGLVAAYRLFRAADQRSAGPVVA